MRAIQPHLSEGWRFAIDNGMAFTFFFLRVLNDSEHIAIRMMLSVTVLCITLFWLTTPLAALDGSCRSLVLLWPLSMANVRAADARVRSHVSSRAD